MPHTCALQGGALYPSRLTRQSGSNHTEITRTAQAINQLGINQVTNTNKANKKARQRTNCFLPRKRLRRGKFGVTSLWHRWRCRGYRHVGYRGDHPRASY